MAKAKSDAAEEAAEKPQEKRLTPLGRSTLAKMKKKFGEEKGEAEFQKAIRAGHLDRSRMMAR